VFPKKIGMEFSQHTRTFWPYDLLHRVIHGHQPDKEPTAEFSDYNHCDHSTSALTWHNARLVANIPLYTSNRC